MTTVTTRPEGMGSIIEIVYDYWVGLSDAFGRPQRAAFDPLVIGTHHPKVLPHIWLCDVERDPYRFCYRILGGEVKTAGGMPNKGDYADQFDPSGAAQANLVLVCETGQPWRRRGPPLMPHNNAITELESLVLPLFDAEGGIEQLLGCTMYSWQVGFAPRSF